jgi:hypothetical protein
MTIDTGELRVHVYTEGFVRGLPVEIGSTLRCLEQPWDKVNRWYRAPNPADVEAELSVRGIDYRVHEGTPGPVPPQMMTEEEAEQATQELCGLAGRVDTTVIRMTYLANDILKRRGWKVLGYPSFEAYCQDRLPFTLPKQLRKEVVLTAIADGMSIRAAAAVARTSPRTAERDLATAANAAVGPTGTGADGRERTRSPNREPEPVLQGHVVDMRPRSIPPLPRDCADDETEAMILALESGWYVSEPLRLRALRLLELAGQRNDLGYTT